MSSIHDDMGVLITQETRTKVSALRGYIWGLCKGITIRELVDNLMSDPYNIQPEDLWLVALAINGLLDDNLLRVNCKVNRQQLTIELVFIPGFFKKLDLPF